MSPDTQAFRNDCFASKADLRSEVGSDLDHTTTSVLSFVGQDVQEDAPRGVVNALGEMTIAGHPVDVQVFNNNETIIIGVNLGCLEEKIPSLPRDFEMGLGHAASCLAPSAAPFGATGENALLTSQGLLARAVIAGIRNRSTLRVSQENFKPNVQPDGRLFFHWLNCWHLANNESVPMSIGPEDQMGGLGGSFQWPMEFYLDGPSQLSRNTEMFLIGIQPDIFALSVLSEVDGMPLVGALKAGEACMGVSFLTGEVSPKGLIKTVCKRLYRCGRHMLATPLKLRRQAIFKQELAGLFILDLRLLQHLVIKLSRFREAFYQQATLFFVWEKAILKGFHATNYID